MEPRTLLIRRSPGFLDPITRLPPPPPRTGEPERNTSGVTGATPAQCPTPSLQPSIPPIPPTSILPALFSTSEPARACTGSMAHPGLLCQAGSPTTSPNGPAVSQLISAQRTGFTPTTA